MVEFETLGEQPWVKRNSNNQITVAEVFLELCRLRAKDVVFTKINELQNAMSSEESMRQIIGIWLDNLIEAKTKE